MSDFGTGDKPILSDSQDTKSIVSTIRSEFSQVINGHRIECNQIDGHNFITLNGNPFAGTYIEAIQAAAKLPAIAWDGEFR